MILPELLDLLQCPESRLPLRLADEALVARVNEAVAAGRLKNRLGGIVEATLSGGLVCEGGDLLYPIVDDLPIMLVDEAIPLKQLESQEETTG